MEEPVGNLAGVARPAPHMRAAMRVLHGAGTTIPLAQALDDGAAVESLAGVVAQALRDEGKHDETTDYRAVAARILKAMRTP